MPPVVYMLSSLSDSRRAYIGFTVNLERRLRQHNREIRGGAKKTRRGGPWRVAAVVRGFRTQRSALRFEWAWQHPKRSTTFRHALGPSGAAPRHVKKQLELVKRALCTREVREKWGDGLSLYLR